MPSAEQMLFHGNKDKDGRLLFELFENPNNVILIKTTLETVIVYMLKIVQSN